jgi:hypothetical protein
MLATILVFNIKISRSAGCTRSAQAQRTEEVLFGPKIKRAGKIIVSTVLDSSKGVDQRLARNLVASTFRHSGVQRVKVL